MSSCGGAGAGPAILQLQKWNHLRFQLEPSEFCLASISPTRDLLLLLSYQSEALLIPLIFGKFYSEAIHEPNPPEHASTQRPDSDCARYSNTTEEIVKGTVFPNRAYTFAPEHYPVISGVKSLAWGHYGDAHNQYEDSGFREILVVSGDNGIIIHAFRDPNRNEVFKSVPEREAVHGKWVEWGPTCREAKGFSHSSTYETSESVNVHSTVRDGVSSNTSILPKRWLQTFTTKLDTVVCDGKYLARFPPKSSLPLSAEVVSFDIYDSTFKFLEFLSSSTLRGKGNLRNGTVVGEVDSASFSDLPFEVSTEPGAGVIHYRCSRVFNNSSHNLIGLVLNFPENVSGENTEARIRNAGQNSVVVMMLNPWGLQWVCSVDLQDNYPCPGPSSEWADFQFLDDFLVCLNTSGLICIWGAKTGHLVAHFDALKSCGLDLKVCSGLNQAVVSVNRDSAPTTMNFSQNADHNEVHGRGTCVGEIICARTFRKLMVVSHSFLLAVIDEQGVIYVIWAAKYVSEKCGAVKSFVHPHNYYDCGVLAGCEIGRQKPLSDLSPCSGSHISTQSIRDSSNTKGSQLYNYSSGFSTFSQLNGLKISHPEHKITAAPLRKVFLPLNKYNKEDSICFSPFGITRLVRSCSGKQQNNYKIVHTTLHVVSPVLDDRDLDAPCVSKSSSSREEVIFSGESIGCCFQGCLYLVSRDGLSVILPSVSVSSSVLPTEFIRYWQPNTTATSGSQIKILLATDEFKELGRPWQMEVLDRTLLYEGPEEAERICLENGWDLKISRMRRMQLSLHYLKSDEIEKSLDMLVDVNLAEDGILCLLFSSVRRIFCKAGSDSEVALASRLLALAASFATKMVRKYGLAEHKKEKLLYEVKKDLGISYVQPLWKKHDFDEISNSRRLYEMARFLEVIRILQSRQSSKNRGLGQALAGGTEAANVGDTDVLQDDSLLPVAKMDSVSYGLLNTSETQAKIELSLTASELTFDNSKQLALSPKESADGEANLHEFNDAGIVQRMKTISLENPTNMIARWGLDNVDLKAMVKDALDSGRLPLAVLQLHLLRRKELVSAKNPPDTFNEISEIGRAIAYDLFLKGESELAVSTLLRLGEDVEVILRELLFGTVRRSLRKQIAEAIKKYGNLRPHEWKTLERISLIERLYPSCSFWKTFLERQKDILGDSSNFTSPDANNLKLNFRVHDNLTIECGDIDGVVTDSWINVGGGSPEACEDNLHAAYWTCAAIWCDAWDQRIVDRIVLDQPCHVDVHAAWESQLDYHMSHNDWEKVFKLLDVIPTSVISEGSLEINLNSSPSAANMRTHTNFPDHAMYICADGEELEPLFIDVPDVRIFRSSTLNTCSSWLKMLVEQELAKKYIFLKEYWESTAEIVPLLVRAGLIIDGPKISVKDEPSMSSLDLAVLDMGRKPHKDAGVALHKLVVHYCTQYNLPNLLDLYIDHCNLVHDDDSFSPFLDAAGDCQWAKWLLFSRIKGHEYEASLSNTRSNLSRQMVLGSNLSVLEIDEIIHTVDDMAEGGGEMAALATLMYAAAPLQECVCAGSVNRHHSFSSQCTLENLQATLQHFPTLWRTLVNACFGQDDNNCSLNSNTANVFGNSALSDYLKWRDTIFSSVGGDTSLIQMLPCWFPKSIRRLVTLLFQGPLGLQLLSGSVPTGESSFYRENAYAINTTGNAGFSPINWEAAIQRSVEALYSSVEEKGFGVEHYLHRGRALAAFIHILGVRASKLKSDHVHKELSGQNIQSDLQAILAPMSQSEVSLLSSLPRTVDVIIEDDIVDSCKPGDRVAIVGVYKALPGKSKGSMNGVFRTVLIANNVSLLNKEANAPIYSLEDLKRMKEIAKRNDTLDLLGYSLAPSIYGHLWIKKAVILLMLGGVEKNLKNGTHLRGDINMMMVGDPSVAKSQLLRAVMNVVPLAISTTGRGSSGVGLTAAVTSDQETGERRLEAGAMVLADRGVVCIDEFDKMNDQDRVAIHEVMEQQTVTIAKAGIHASLNARCSVVAAANPIYGTYDRSLTPTKNIGLPDSLLSRFDLLFIVLDQMDPEIDRQISEHVSRMHRYCADDGGMGTLDKGSRYTEEDDGGDINAPIFVKYDRILHGQEKRRGKRSKHERLTIKFLKKYIHYAKNRIQPKLTDEASDHIATSYAELRDTSANAKSGGGTLPITARTLETMIRLSTAHAKMKLRNEVLKTDVEAALKVLNFAIYHKELTDMDEREKEREMEMKRKADLDAANDGNADDGGSTGDAMEVDGNPTADEEDNSPERVQTFETILGQHVVANHLDQISIDEIEQLINRESAVPYTRQQVTSLLERMQDSNRIMISDGIVRII